MGASWCMNQTSSIACHKTKNKTDCSTDGFKHKPDKYLQTIPDLPRIPEYINLTIMDTNSLVEMTKLSAMTTAPTLDY